MSGEIHSELQVFEHPIVFLADSIIAVSKLSMVKAVTSWRMLQRFMSMMLNFYLMSVLFSFKMSGHWFHAIPLIAFLSFKVIADVHCIQLYAEYSLTNGFPLQQGVGVLAGNDECDSFLVVIVLSA